MTSLDKIGLNTCRGYPWSCSANICTQADMYDSIKVYEGNIECIENETMCYLGMVWSARQRSELGDSKILY